ncbi:glycosyltransferase family 2 protein [Rhodocytophaga aerolata]|uniref:Glycosyltransferase family 2 protein n=1 Tax=Rhodocytophaga aerolata TaxID=455078 RepID=A0ABT8RG69_9BACT|nr:glycosyltransferase family 2 protein [Rhodocytophaga aerolata]MDO1450979.1 glycosyltransferase family 2 protein [Rhodocytophaga aerolata]
MKDIEISIVIPVYNSQDCVIELVERINEHLAGFKPFELILVNDKSKDLSWQRIIEVTRNYHWIKGINLKKNAGQDNAIMAGLGFARGEYIVIMDDDLQHSPKDIPLLYTTCKKGNDVCYGSFLEKKQKSWKNLGSELNGYLAGKFLKKPEELYLSPFKIIHRSVVDKILEYKGPFPYIDAIILGVTSNIVQIKLEHQKRYAGTSNYNILRSISVFLKHVTGYSVYPLRVATFIGFSASILSFLLGIYYLLDYLLNDHKVEGFITIVLLIVFFNGIILICLGLIGEYVGRIYLTINNKPQYSIDTVIRGKQQKICE